MEHSEPDPLRRVVIGSPGGSLQATFVPDAGMVCSSLRHEGAELLAQRNGLRAYAERGSTMGIPLLYPWANRLSGPAYQGPRGVVELAHENALLKFDEHGLPIHGVIPSALSWELIEGPEHGSAERLRAIMRWQRPELLAIYPYPHSVEVCAHTEQSKLTIETVLLAEGEVAVPVSFGYHPYLTLPGVAREAWQVELAVGERLMLDSQMIPTGAREPFERRRFALADNAFDDAFAGLLAPPLFTLSGGGRRIELEFLNGYSYTQLYSPAGERFACFEPMTAPTNALISGDGLRLAKPGEPFRAAFSISLSRFAPRSA
jgi:galactose mutarotase-like enzyme